MILIISSSDDVHIPFVTKHLKTKHIVLDAKSIIDKRELTYKLENGNLHIIYNGQVLKDIAGIWFRRPRHNRYELDIPVESKYQDYSRTALQSHINQLYAVTQQAAWISDYYAIERANNKMWQLLMACRIGFNVPETVFTSSPEQAKKFLHAYPSSIVKPLARNFPVPQAGKQLVFFTRKISVNQPLRLDGLHLAPAIFQSAIELDFDIRVTVVGERYFAAKITASGADFVGVRDWRVGHEDGSLQISPIDLEGVIAQQCIALTKQLGLKFGAIDLIQDINGRIWFIEINPNGQWAFIEEETKQPIGKALAMLLEGRNS